MNPDAVIHEYSALLRSRARRYARILGMPFEDTLQEACLAVVQELPKFRPELGRLSSFLETRIYQHLRRLRPEWVELETDPFPRLWSEAGAVETADQLRFLQLRMLNRLKGQEKLVWSLLVSPEQEFRQFLMIHDLEASPTTIARYLRLDVYSVQRSMQQIRHQLTLLFDLPELSDLVDWAIKARCWPLVHVSHHGSDVAFVEGVRKRRGLEGEMARREHEAIDATGRTIEHYEWGVVLYLFHGTHEATVVAEGRWRDNRDGYVGSSLGYWRTIADSLSWYRNARKVLRSA